MATWGTMIENLFVMRDKNKQTRRQLTLDTWLTTRRPEKNWKARKKKITNIYEDNNHTGGDRGPKGAGKVP